MRMCKECGRPIDREYKGVGARPKYCLRRECVLARKAKVVKIIYYKKQGRWDLVHYVKEWQ